jgi:UDP-glucose 4-epimerase
MSRGKGNEAPRVVVFGGSGFLGSHVADELSEQGFQVAIYDRSPSPYLRPDQEMIVADILDKEQVLKACNGADYIYNFAGIADINEAKTNPEKTITLNIMGNYHILEAARLSKVKRFVFASTVYVFSESGGFYRASKQACEKYVELYWSNYKLPFTILRYGSLYGRRSDERNGIYSYIKEALEKRELTYDGTGDELREYIHAEDASAASVSILSEEYRNQHIVLTGHQAIRIRDIFTMIREMLGDDIKIHFNNSELDAHYRITPYTHKPKIGKKLVTNPFVDIGQGLLDCIKEISEKFSEQDILSKNA